MNNISNQIYLTSLLLQKNVFFVLLIIAGLFIIHILNGLSGYRLIVLGIYPRKWFGLPGIIFHPFLHGDFNHIFFNSIPLFVLMSFILLSGTSTFICATVTIILLSGIAIWLLGRPSYHIGASGLIMGYLAYLIMNTYHQPSVISIGVVAVCLYYFGTLLLHLFSFEAKLSWEAHIFGFFAGIAASYICIF